MNLRIVASACVAAFVAVTGVTYSSIAASAGKGISASAETSIFEGDWESVFGSHRLIFRFHTDSGVTTGWFVSTLNGQSYPLKDVIVRGRTLSFVYTSSPELTYTLTAQEGDQVLTGISSRPDGQAMPQTLTRKSN